MKFSGEPSRIQNKCFHITSVSLNNSGTWPSFNRSKFQKETTMRLFTIALLVAIAATAQAGDRDRKCKESKRHESHNYIIERQQAGQVSGVPILRRIRGSREIDIYRDGSMYEKNNFIGSTRR
jgi:hypothetical protein